MPYPFNVKFRLVAHTGDGLRKAPNILSKELRGTFEGLGKRLKASAEARMRRDRGESIRSLKREVTGRGLDLSVVVYSTLLKAFIDAYGLRPGTRVPYGFGSRLRHWAERRVKFGPSKEVRTVGPYTGAGPNRVFSGKTGSSVRTIATPKRSRITTSDVKVLGTNRIQSKSRAAERLSYLVARSIYTRGVQASRWNKQALESNRSRIVRELKNAITRAARQMRRG